MRFAVPLCTLLCAVSLSIHASAAIAFEEPSAQQPAVSVSEFAEGASPYTEKQRKFRLEEQRRAKMRRQVLIIAMIVVPVVLIALVAFLYVRSRSETGRRRSINRTLKQSEERRRSGGPERALDPRQW